MRYLFLVQGEGRGHMTQAISLYLILKDRGHDVAGVLFGKNPYRKIPLFVYEKFDTFTAEFESPNFILKKNTKGICITRSFIYNLARIARFFKSIKFIRSIIIDKKPDAIINFYDVIGGLYNFFYPGKRFFCVSHHFLLAHGDFPFPKGRKIEKWFLLMHNALVSINAEKRFALSFRPMEKSGITNAIVVPPLLRKNFLPTDINTIKHSILLGYLLNHGYSTEIIEWHKSNKELQAHFFWDKPDVPKSLSVHENLTFHQIDDTLFLDFFKKCSMFAETAGFESLCEAMYLGIPFLCVPSENHYEQACNALDATLEGAGIWDTSFDLDKLIKFHARYNFDPANFRKWVNAAPEMFLKHLE
jgi:uncharacterized protein (TIGR00661 family)